MRNRAYETKGMSRRMIRRTNELVFFFLSNFMQQDIWVTKEGNLPRTVKARTLTFLPEHSCYEFDNKPYTWRLSFQETQGPKMVRLRIDHRRIDSSTRTQQPSLHAANGDDEAERAGDETNSDLFLTIQLQKSWAKEDKTWPRKYPPPRALLLRV